MNDKSINEHSGAATGADQRQEAAAPDDWRQEALEGLTVEDFEKVILRAESGNPRAIKVFNDFLSTGGSAAWRAMGDLADVAGKSLARRMYPSKKGPPLAIRRHFQELRKDLATDHATPLEKLAIDRVILASMFAAAVDCLVAAEGAAGLTSEKRIQAQAAAEKRMQVALKSLKTAREISRAAVAGPLRLFGSRARSAEPASQAAV